MEKKRGTGGLVYSTDRGRICPGCRHPEAECICRDQSRQTSTGARDGSVLLSRETKGRKGAGVTLIQGLPLDGKALDALAKKLKSACGVGGSVKDGAIELQGEQRDRLAVLLEKEGFRVKRSGG